jgi:hypothetical protein
MITLFTHAATMITTDMPSMRRARLSKGGRFVTVVSRGAELRFCHR